MNRKIRTPRRYPMGVFCALTALLLAACGGGSSAGEPAGNPAQSAQVEGNATVVAVAGPAASPEPRSPPVPREAGVPISANTTAQRNTRYDISGTGSTPIDLTLPQFILPGDFVSVRGVSGRPWRIVPNCCPGTTARSDMTPQAVVTTNLPGNVAPGQRWTPRMAVGDQRSDRQCRRSSHPERIHLPHGQPEIDHRLAGRHARGLKHRAGAPLAYAGCLG